MNSVYKVELSVDKVLASGAYSTLPFDSLKISTLGEWNIGTYEFSPNSSPQALQFSVRLNVLFNSGEQWTSGDNLGAKISWTNGSYEKTKVQSSDNTKEIGFGIDTLINLNTPSVIYAEIYHDSAVSHTLASNSENNSLCIFGITRY